MEERKGRNHIVKLERQNRNNSSKNDQTYFEVSRNVGLV